MERTASRGRLQPTLYYNIILKIKGSAIHFSTPSFKLNQLNQLNLILHISINQILFYELLKPLQLSVHQ